jgi:septal ring factor EnvC (AmiA/AmiB activator)
MTDLTPGADWDGFFEANQEISIDLAEVTVADIEAMLENRATDEEITHLADTLTQIAAEERDRRKKIARIMSALSKVGDIGLKLFKVVT